MALTRPVVPPDGSFICSNLLIFLRLAFFCVTGVSKSFSVNVTSFIACGVGFHKQADVVPPAKPGRSFRVGAIAEHLRCEAMAAAMEGQPLEVPHGLCRLGYVLVPKPAQRTFRPIERLAIARQIRQRHKKW